LSRAVLFDPPRTLGSLFFKFKFPTLGVPPQSPRKSSVISTPPAKTNFLLTRIPVLPPPLIGLRLGGDCRRRSAFFLFGKVPLACSPLRYSDAPSEAVHLPALLFYTSGFNRSMLPPLLCDGLFLRVPEDLFSHGNTLSTNPPYLQNY